MNLELSSLQWKVCGYRPYYWFERKGIEHTGHFQPDVQPISAVIPGSVYTALRKAKKLPDWRVGNDSFLCQWVEHFQWEFFTELPAIKYRESDSIVLHCEGLDYSGWIGIDGKQVAEFRGALIRHRFDLTEYLNDGKPHRLSILFDLPPEEQGQAGVTSRTHFFKPRYNFSWDWTPRLVPIGIWDQLWIEAGQTEPRVVKVLSFLEDDLKTGKVDVMVDSPRQAADVSVSISRRGKVVRKKTVSCMAGTQTISLAGLAVEPWFSNGYGKQPLYEVKVSTGPGKDSHRCNVGFKRVRWLAVPGTPEGSPPNLCEVNGVQVFLQGVNWTPIRMDYHDTPPSEYKKRIDLYKEMGCTVFRVWGGAFLEREFFYDLCDRAGILVWQEFPLSSSTMESTPPHDAGAIAQLKEIARDYIRRRAHHASKLLWCGGNELQTPPGEGGWLPLQADDVCLAALKEVVETEDPGTCFLPTSPSGKRFFGNAEDIGKGLHAHVHGPWNHHGSWEEAVKYWTNDDAGFRSECGMPSLQSFKLMKKYAGKLPTWPPTKDNPLWSHTSLFWLPKGRFDKQLKGLKGDAALKKFIAITEEWQIKILTLAASSCKSRFPNCAGFIIWMGHDCFPCPINTSVLDVEGKPKPVYHALKKIFRQKTPVQRIVPLPPP